MICLMACNLNQFLDTLGHRAPAGGGGGDALHAVNAAADAMIISPCAGVFRAHNCISSYLAAPAGDQPEIWS